VLVLILVTSLVLPRMTSLATYDHLSVDRRLQLNQVALTQIQQNPLLGIGLSNHIISLYNYGPLYGIGIWRQPVHNIYLLSAAQIGLPATLAWLMVILTSISKLITTRRSSPVVCRYLSLFWFSIAIIGLFDHFWLTIHPATLTIPILL